MAKRLKVAEVRNLVVRRHAYPPFARFPIGTAPEGSRQAATHLQNLIPSQSDVGAACWNILDRYTLQSAVRSWEPHANYD
jgi:hypothetical protein